MEDENLACKNCGSMSATFIKDDLDFRFDTLRYRCDGCGRPIMHKKREGWEERELWDDAARLYSGTNTQDPYAVLRKLGDFQRQQLILERQIAVVELAMKSLLALRFYSP